MEIDYKKTYAENFIKKFQQGKKRRLFLTTGNISLINSQAIIKGLPGEFAQNFLVIHSSKPDQDFFEYNSKLILDGIFDYFSFANEESTERNIFFVDDNSFLDLFDEIYVTSQPGYVNIFHHKTIYIIEEGISSYFLFDNMVLGNIKNLFLSNFLGKLFHHEKACLEKTIVLEKEKIKQIIFEIRSKNDLNYSFLKRKNQVLVLSQYIYNDIMNDEEVVLFYKENIDVLLKIGYSVLFKSHPRVYSRIIRYMSELYRDNPDFLVFPENVKYPVELIMPDLDCEAVLSSMSGGALNCAHLFDIPYYGFGAKRLMNHPNEYIERYKALFLEHVPHISEIDTNYRWEKLSSAIKVNEIPKFTEIRLETTNVCGYKCFMCPRNKMTRKVGVMSIKDFNYVLDVFDYIKYELNFHLHGYGEAFVCQDLPQRLALLASRKPNFNPVIVTTLGYKRDANWIESLFKNGLRNIYISMYGYDDKTYYAVHGIDRFNLVKNNLQLLTELQKKYGFNLNICLDQFGKNYPLPVGYTVEILARLKSDFIAYLNHLGAMNIIVQPLHNFGDGFSDFYGFKKTVPCSVCWGIRRQHISISWDLNVSPCCFDYDCSIIWGNLKTSSLIEIYRSQNRMDFIKSHFMLGTLPKICTTCSCDPNEGHYDYEYKLIKKFMKENNGEQV